MFYHHHLSFVICICTSASNTNFTPSWYQVRALFSQFRLLLLIIPMKKKKQQKTQMKMETRAAVIYGYLFLVVLLFAANNRGNFLQKKTTQLDYQESHIVHIQSRYSLASNKVISLLGYFKNTYIRQISRHVCSNEFLWKRTHIYLLSRVSWKLKPNKTIVIKNTVFH